MSVASASSGTPAGVSPACQGTAVIPTGGPKIVAVADPRITAQSVVVAWGLGAVDATATSIDVDVVSPGVGFTITTNAAPTTAAKRVGWAVLKY